MSCVGWLEKKSRNGLQLSFKPCGKREGKRIRDGRWFKIIDGKATYFGRGDGNPELVSQFLAHADGRTARWYIDRSFDPFDLNTDKLDAAVNELEVYFGLSCD